MQLQLHLQQSKLELTIERTTKNRLEAIQPETDAAAQFPVADMKSKSIKSEAANQL